MNHVQGLAAFLIPDPQVTWQFAKSSRQGKTDPLIPFLLLLSSRLMLHFRPLHSPSSSHQLSVVDFRHVLWQGRSLRHCPQSSTRSTWKACSTVLDHEAQHTLLHDFLWYVSCRDSKEHLTDNEHLQLLLGLTVAGEEHPRLHWRDTTRNDRTKRKLTPESLRSRDTHVEDVTDTRSHHVGRVLQGAWPSMTRRRGQIMCPSPRARFDEDDFIEIIQYVPRSESGRWLSSPSPTLRTAISETTERLPNVDHPTWWLWRIQVQFSDPDTNHSRRNWTWTRRSFTIKAEEEEEEAISIPTRLSGLIVTAVMICLDRAKFTGHFWSKSVHEVRSSIHAGNFQDLQ